MTKKTLLFIIYRETDRWYEEFCLEWELKRPPKNLQSNPHPPPPTRRGYAVAHSIFLDAGAGLMQENPA